MDIARSLIGKLRRLLRSRGRSLDETDDLIQEAFLRLQVYCRDHVVESQEAFLVRTVLNLAVDQFRRQRFTMGDDQTFTGDDQAVVNLIDPSPRPEDVVAAQQNLRRFRLALERLPPRTREALLLQRLEGYTYQQIATHLGISVSAVEKHIAKAMLFLTTQGEKS
jgi:RNA polymerase sigma factor (sigma-70 family)